MKTRWNSKLLRMAVPVTLLACCCSCNGSKELDDEKLGDGDLNQSKTILQVSIPYSPNTRGEIPTEIQDITFEVLDLYEPSNNKLVKINPASSTDNFKYDTKTESYLFTIPVNYSCPTGTGAIRVVAYANINNLDSLQNFGTDTDPNMFGIGSCKAAPSTINKILYGWKEVTELAASENKVPMYGIATLIHHNSGDAVSPITPVFMELKRLWSRVKVQCSVSAEQEIIDFFRCVGNIDFSWCVNNIPFNYALCRYEDVIDESGKITGLVKNKYVPCPANFHISLDFYTGPKFKLEDRTLVPVSDPKLIPSGTGAYVPTVETVTYVEVKLSLNKVSAWNGSSWVDSSGPVYLASDPNGKIYTENNKLVFFTSTSAINTKVASGGSSKQYKSPDLYYRINLGNPSSPNLPLTNPERFRIYGNEDFTINLEGCEAPSKFPASSSKELRGEYWLSPPLFSESVSLKVIVNVKGWETYERHYGIGTTK